MDTDPDYQDEVLARVSHARAMRRRCVKRAALWRTLARKARAVEACRAQYRIEWDNVRYWVQSELSSLGR